MTASLELDGVLAIEDVIDVAVAAGKDDRLQSTRTVGHGREVVEHAAESGVLVYGVTTGIGDLAKVRVEATGSPKCSKSWCGLTPRRSVHRSQRGSSER